ncbi:uncharacterized protein BX664DRAFT_382193 [Halteromyces radiatus]|uniref:uncharacterized protein n=1 Tax=Halteromyces radiatus TaxID=101107 RepID=UPI00221F0C89|nr:uncharacterized protein BX664DRAFT_382193 [Halteromyces radiatus]KAI8099692.1 hypothetical protein BX664DRAFT_382193 [Halteromyces radiatus]
MACVKAGLLIFYRRYFHPISVVEKKKWKNEDPDSKKERQTEDARTDNQRHKETKNNEEHGETRITNKDESVLLREPVCYYLLLDNRRLVSFGRFVIDGSEATLLFEIATNIEMTTFLPSSSSTIKISGCEPEMEQTLKDAPNMQAIQFLEVHKIHQSILFQ